ncbi:MAG: ATP-binding protein [Desulfuromonadaceae bacterium]
MKKSELNREQNESESERKRYVELFDLAPVGYLVIDAAGLIRNANLAVVTMLGASRTTLLNKQVVQFIYAEDQEMYALRRKQCFESNTPQAWEMRLVRGDGSPLWVHLQATPARNGEYWVTLNDITGKKQADAYAEMGREIRQILLEQVSLHDSMRRSLDALKMSTGFDAVGIRLQDGEDFPYFVQNGFSADFLLTENTLIGRSADGGICRDTDGNVSLECTCGLIISGKTDPENPLFTKGGSCWTNDSFPLLALPPDRDPRLHPRNQCIHQNYASIALIPIRVNDKILGLIQFNDRRKGCFTLEIIELLEGVATLLGESIMRKRMEDAQIRSEKILKNVQQITHIGSWYLDVATNQVVWTEELYKMYGFDPSLPLPPYTEHQKLFTSESWEMLSSSLARTRDTGVPYELELKTVREDGDNGWMWVRGEAVLDEGGKTVGLWGAAQDITRRKQAEQELQNKNAEMECFAYTISHDLKSPLITIQAYTGMIMKDMEVGRYERAREDIKRIEGAADKMTALLNDLLELSSAGRLMNEPMQVDMNRLVKDMLEQLSGSLKQSQVEVVAQPDLPAVPGDPKRIAEVVQNLIENAIKYRGDQPALRIEIGVRNDGKECIFFVSDNGTGIDPRFHESIFGLFKKLDVNSEGTGVGPALVKRIIEVHGGRIWVESEGDGKGSRFCFTLVRFDGTKVT